jgi:hypothetical protein
MLGGFRRVSLVRGQRVLPIDLPGVVGEWVDVTPAALTFSSGGADQFGVQDVRVHPATPTTAWFWACYDGCWQTTDGGETWAKVSGASILDDGKNWSSAISKDGDYLLNCCGNNTGTGGNGGSAQVNQTVQYSTDGGVTWTKTASFGTGLTEVYCVRTSPFDNLRAIACTKFEPSRFFESLDGGRTWTDHGDFSASLASAYVSYLHNSDTVLFIGQDGGNAHRLTKSGGSWSSSAISDLSGVGHYHGMLETVYDSAQGALWMPAGGGSADGIYKSTNDGVNWTRVYSTSSESVMVRTATKLYAMFGAPLNGGTWDSKFTSADINPGTSFAAPVDPNALYGMANGAKAIGVVTSGSQVGLLAGAWRAGVWMYRES